MQNASAWPADGIENIVRTYGNTLYRLCFVMLGNESDAEDAVQESFIKYLQKASPFENTVIQMRHFRYIQYTCSSLLHRSSNKIRFILQIYFIKPQSETQ